MGKTILIVDKDRSVRSMASFVLSLESCLVIEASSPAEAIRRLDGGSASPELIIAGTDAEGVDFRESVKALRSHPRCRFTPVIAVVDGRCRLSHMELKDAGASSWITKPFTAYQLLDAVGLLGH